MKTSPLLSDSDLAMSSRFCNFEVLNRIEMIEEARKKVFEYLNKEGIEFELHEHPQAPTVEIAMQYWKDIPGVTHCKNLFLRNHKGNQHYLVILPWDKPLDIHALWEKIGSTRLSFASPERMMKYLGVPPGSVSLFGLLNDATHSVNLLLDKDLETADRISFHPNDNTASLVISNAGFHRFLSLCPNPWQFITIP